MTSSIKSTWLGAIYTVLIANDKTKSVGVLNAVEGFCRSRHSAVSIWNHRITGLESTGDGKAVLSHPNSLQTIELLSSFSVFVFSNLPVLATN